MRGTPSRRALALACVAVAAACASLRDAPGSAVAGCYQFRWDAGARALGLPWGLVLLDEPLGEGWLVARQFPAARRAETATSPTGREDHPFGYWRRTSGDSVEVGHPGGGAGFVLTLAPEGRDLVGRGAAVGDALAPGQPPGPAAPRPVVAFRVVCGAR